MKQGKQILLRVFRLSPLPGYKLFSVCIIDVLIFFFTTTGGFNFFVPPGYIKLKKKTKKWDRLIQPRHGDVLKFLSARTVDKGIITF